MKFLLTASLAAITVSLCGCASIVDGQNQSLSVSTLPKNGATCKLTNGKGT